MKNSIKFLALLAIGASAASCSISEVDNGADVLDNGIFFSLKTGETKTYIVASEDRYSPMWNKGDEIGVLFGEFESGKSAPDGTLTNSEEDGAVADFEGTIEGAPKEDTLYAFYPAKFAKTYGDQTVGFDIVANQKPTATSFDPEADLLISKPVAYTAAEGAVVIGDVYFARALSMLKINVYSSDFDAIQGQFLSKLTVTAVGDTLAGRPVFDLTKGDAKVIKYNTNSESVSAIYDGEVISVGSSKEAMGNNVFLMVAPGTLNKDAKLKFEGETGGYTFSKEVTLPSDIALKPGKYTEINLGIAEGNCTPKVAETRIWVDNFEKCTENKTKYEVSQTGAKGTGLNKNTSYDYGAGDIRINNNGHSSSDPYLYVPGSNTFTVKNLSVSEETALILSAQTKNAGTVTLKCKESTAEEWTEIGSWTSTGSFSEQKTIFNIASTATSIDLSFTASASIIIDDIVLEKFVDQRTTLAVPENVKAEADATTSNKVNVTWDAVENAGSYEVTLSTEGEEDVVEEAATNSINFTGLKYSTQYSVKVKAIPSDVALYKDSEYSAAVDVTTGAQPAVMIYFEKVTTALTDWCGDYLIVYETGNVAFDGSLETLDAVSNTKAVEINNNKILATDDMRAIQFTVAFKTGSSTVYSLRSASGKYISGTTTTAKASNGMKQADSDADYEISFNGITVESKSSDQQMVLRYNKSSGQTRFRFFKSGQEEIALYKLSDPRTALATPEITVEANSSAKTVKVTWTCTDAMKIANYNITCGDNLSYTTQGGTDGNYTFENVEPGTYTVTVEANPSDATTYKPSKATGSATIEDLTPVISIPNWPAAADATETSVAFGYTITNPVQGKSLSVTITEGDDWITSATADASNVTVTFGENTTSSIRKGKLTLSYEGAADKTVTITQNGAATVYESLEALVAAGEPTTDGISVTVSFSNKEIIDFYKSGQYTNGIWLPVVGAPSDKIEIYCKNVPSTWALGGMVSGTLTSCQWKKYNDNTWELCPSNWDDIIYTAPLPKCETPVITLDGANATITCATAGATIFYEIADTEPASFTHTYSDPVALTDGQTIWAKATLAGHPDSDVASKKYTAGGGTHEESFTIKSDDVVTNSSYAKYETTVDNRGWIITFGGNNKSVGTNSSNRSKCTLSSYSKYAVSPVTTSDIASAYASTTKLTGVKKISYTFNDGSNQTNTNVYVIYSSDGNTFSQISLSSGTQGAAISSETAYEFTPCDGYFALLFKATNSSGNWRIDDVNITFTYDVTD